MFQGGTITWAKLRFNAGNSSIGKNLSMIRKKNKTVLIELNREPTKFKRNTKNSVGGH